MIDGRLLQPTRPALSLDSTFVQRAFGSGGPNGHIVAAYTEVGIPWPQKRKTLGSNYLIQVTKH